MDLAQGQVVDRYTVLGQLGRGGMAVVYRVRHNTLGTEHALKVLTLAVTSIRDRLIQEGRVQARLKHPNIVAVTDVLDVQGQPGLLMELVRGPSLEDWLGSNRPPLPLALQLFDGILDALEEAHRIEVVHRDLKPGNVMLSTHRGELRPLVTDFGLAKLLADESTPNRTCTGLPMGTPAYMSPEQITDAKSVDQRTDIFALGCILYELVCGQNAFQGANTLEVFNAVASGSYVPPRELRPDLPEPVVRAIQGCLQQQREQRIPSCEALAAVLQGELGAVHPSDAPTLPPAAAAAAAPVAALGVAPAVEARAPLVLPPASSATPTFALTDSMEGSLAPSQADTEPRGDPEAPRRVPWGLVAVATVLVVLVVGVGLAGGAAGIYWLTRPQVAESTESSSAPSSPEPADAVEPTQVEVADVLERESHASAPSEASPVSGGPATAPAPSGEHREAGPLDDEGAPGEQPVAAPKTGVVRVEGDAVSVMLVDASSQRHQPGSLPVGTYDVEASFSNGTTIRQPRLVKVRSGRSTTVRCSQQLETCR